MFLRTSLLLSLLVFKPAFSQSNLLPPSAALPKLGDTVLRDSIDQVKAVKRLPVNTLTMVETLDGKVFLVSDNGRLAILGGRWVDLWEGKNITSIADSASLDKINFARMGINLEDFAPYTIGTGPKQVIAFIDPTCDECRQLVRDMKSFSASHTFKVILLPVKGSPSGLAARRMYCAPDKALALDAFLNASFESLPSDTSKCDPAPVQRAMLTAMVLGIRTAPYLVLPDGFTVSGPQASNSLSNLLLGR